MSAYTQQEKEVWISELMKYCNFFDGPEQTLPTPIQPEPEELAASRSTYAIQIKDQDSTSPVSIFSVDHAHKLTAIALSSYVRENLLTDDLQGLFNLDTESSERKQEYWKQGKPFDVFLSLDFGAVSLRQIDVRVDNFEGKSTATAEVHLISYREWPNPGDFAALKLGSAYTVNDLKNLSDPNDPSR